MFRALMEPFWDFKFGEYVEYLMRVSREYLISSVLPSLTSSNSWISRVLLADVILWMYIDSPALYIARTMSSVPLDRSEAILCYRVLLCDWSFETCHYRGWEPLSDSRCRLCTRYNDNFYHIHHFHYAATEDMVKFSLYNPIRKLKISNVLNLYLKLKSILTGDLIKPIKNGITDTFTGMYIFYLWLPRV